MKFPLRGTDGSLYGVGSMATDITVLKQLQEELRRHQDELAHVLRLHTIGEMAAALAHEINQPLCAITNYAQGGVQRLRGDTVDPAALLQAFEHIAHEGLRAGEILRGIRSLVRRDADLESAIDVNALAGEALRVLEPQARLHGVTVRLEGGAGIPLVHANPTQIEQVMVNLMLNGVQATAGRRGRAPRGGGGDDLQRQRRGGRGERYRQRHRARRGRQALHALRHHQGARPRPRPGDQPLDHRESRRPPLGDGRTPSPARRSGSRCPSLPTRAAMDRPASTSVPPASARGCTERRRRPATAGAACARRAVARDGVANAGAARRVPRAAARRATPSSSLSTRGRRTTLSTMRICGIMRARSGGVSGAARMPRTR